MAKLSEESCLYNNLYQKYDDKKEDITLELFEECIDIAKEANSREIRFVLFKLKSLYDDTDIGIDNINKLTKIAKCLVGNNYKASFLICVLETALEEKKN